METHTSIPDDARAASRADALCWGNRGPARRACRRSPAHLRARRRKVERKRGLIEPHRGTPARELEVPGAEVVETVRRHLNALGGAGRARGEQDVREILAGDPAGAVREAALRDDAEELVAIEQLDGACAFHAGKRLACEHRQRRVPRYLGRNRRHALGRDREPVDRYVRAARLHAGEKARDHERMLVAVDHDRLTRGRDARDPGRQGLRREPELEIRHAVPLRTCAAPAPEAASAPCTQCSPGTSCLFHPLRTQAAYATTNSIHRRERLPPPILIWQVPNRVRGRGRRQPFWSANLYASLPADDK